MMRLAILPPIRKDWAGSGEFGADRGDRSHKGIDFSVYPGSVILSPVNGFVSKYGTCYPTEPYYEYIEIMDRYNNRHRLFYTKEFKVDIGKVVYKGDEIAFADDITKRYPDSMMTPHIHYEIKTATDSYLDPTYYRENYG